ncbi:soluble lytic murein transglycosylase-like protein [Xenococcus sp. PCC 7305]|uniref:lytic transglycosylase domain-containing protein n=1 Tax=Xenococcus sp. PCC 7305 TaxID=102125 RepID=UPI0002ABAED6|nr:transglycosylase SLT domain-containing protein [Xenococcus sp. PCC 7305]ELS04699.1 soluble lytic murein transglycosylase-like protein [Xenococcus sp. PCC 7305]
MGKLLSNKIALAIGLGLTSALTLGSLGYVLKYQIDLTSPIATANEPSLAENRTNFSLAAGFIAQNQGTEALEKLSNLEQSYPILEPYIILKRGQAYQLAGDNRQAEQTWQNLVQSHPDSPAVAEALYFLGQSNPAYWQDAIAKFPQHPRTHQIIRQLLKKNPHQPRLMAILVKYDPDAPGVSEIAHDLATNYSEQLDPQDWQAIADSYWKKWDYGKAGKAYAKAPSTPRNLYRAARGYHLGNGKKTAKKLYLQLLEQYPQAEDTGLGLRRLALIVNTSEALAYLDLVIRDFPQQAPQALLQKAKIFDGLKNTVAAQQMRDLLITDYKNSEAAAEYRWSISQKKAKQGDLLAAWEWAQPIAVNNPRSPVVAKASFWVGKWAQKLGRSEDAKTAFESTLARFPHSYYAWRSAVALGWNVGDFSTIRDIQPQVASKVNFVPPGGSQIFQELYRIGLEEDAWMQFQTEIADQENLSVPDEFTYGLMQLSRGQNLRGINTIWYLKNRTSDEDIEQWQALRQTNEYWQSLFPIPFEEIILPWSQQRQINPLLVSALIRQESRFEPEIGSSAGALGLMQVMPATGKQVAGQIGLQDYSLTNPEDNVNIGTFYLDFTHRKYDDNSMLAVASYNAGPNRVAQWVSRYGLRDADEFVEKIPYRETKGYVESVFENYWNYMRIYNTETAQLFQQISQSNPEVITNN